MGAKLLVSHGARNGEGVNGGADHKKEERESRHGVERTQIPQVVLGDWERAEGCDVICVQWDRDPEVLWQLYDSGGPHFSSCILQTLSLNLVIKI